MSGPDIVAMGELLIDFTFTSISGRGLPMYEANPGGAPANVAIGAKRLGATAAFIGKIGKDSLSALLKKTLIDNGIDCSGLIEDPTRPATLAMVSLDESGDRSFTFYRENCADINMTKEEVNTSLIRGGRAFHFGSVAMTAEPSRSAVLCAAQIAKESGLLISYDPNYRPLLWPDQGTAVEIMKKGLDLCDVLKVSEEELALLSGSNDISEGIRLLADRYGIPLIFATLGSKGCRWLYQGKEGSQGVFDVKTIDTTGAGDSFIAAVLSRILAGPGIGSLKPDDIAKIARYACAASSLTTASYGAIPAMPGAEAVEILLNQSNR